MSFKESEFGFVYPKLLSAARILVVIGMEEKQLPEFSGLPTHTKIQQHTKNWSSQWPGTKILIFKAEET